MRNSEIPSPAEVMGDTLSQILGKSSVCLVSTDTALQWGCVVSIGGWTRQSSRHDGLPTAPRMLLGPTVCCRLGEFWSVGRVWDGFLPIKRPKPFKFSQKLAIQFRNLAFEGLSAYN
jgi:hypothetical protein